MYPIIRINGGVRSHIRADNKSDFNINNNTINDIMLKFSIFRTNLKKKKAMKRTHSALECQIINVIFCL